ncbi:MAG TPA: hypothetical protein VMR95_01260 [Candidatus Binatia bacterium]|nr:hypothetical protein [Candidatus Binatia bacterium]
MEQASISESPNKTSDTKEKSKKDSPIIIPEKDKGKALGRIFSLDTWRRPEKETPQTRLSLRLGTEAVLPIKPGSTDKEEAKPEAVTKPSELTEPTETEVDEDLKEPELHLGSADEAWQRINPDRQITLVEEPTKTAPLEELPAISEQLDETELLTGDQIETTTEENQKIKAEVPEVPSESLLSVTDHEIHDLPLKSSELQARPEPAPDIIDSQIKAIDELPNSDDQPEEIAAEPEQPAQLTYEAATTTEQLITEAEAAGSGNFEPPRPPDAAESAPEPAEPEQGRPRPAADPAETLTEAHPWLADESVRNPQVETVAAAPELPPAPTFIERHTVERRLGLPSLVESISLFGLRRQQNRMERQQRHIHRHEHKQKRQTERFVAQQARANEQLSLKLTQHQTESRRQETTLKRQLKTVNQLLSRPKRIYERAAQPLREKVRILPRSVERITAPLLKPRKANKLPERLATVVNLSPKAREVVPAVAVKYASALEKASIRLSSKPAKQPSLYELPTPVFERPETNFHFTASTKPENLAEQQVKSIVADTAIEQVIQLPQGHHLEQSAWHSIEVDNTGKAVEHPVFDYGQEFTHEQHQEARQQVNLPQWAAAPVSLATNAGGYSSPTTNLTPQPLMPTLPPKMVNPPTIKFENTIREHTQFKLSTADPYALFLVVLVIVFLALAGLIVIH